MRDDHQGGEYILIMFSSSVHPVVEIHSLICYSNLSDACPSLFFCLSPTWVLTHFDTKTTQKGEQECAPENIRDYTSWRIFLPPLIQINLKSTQLVQGFSATSPTLYTYIHIMWDLLIVSFRRTRSDGWRPRFQDKLLAVAGQLEGIKEDSTYFNKQKGLMPLYFYFNRMYLLHGSSFSQWYSSGDDGSGIAPRDFACLHHYLLDSISWITRHSLSFNSIF